MTGTLCWVGGPWLEEGAIDARDAGFCHGLGVFETMAAQAGTLPLWPLHLERLRRGAAFLGIPWQPPADLMEAATALLRRTGLVEGVLRLTLTAGPPHGSGPTWCLTTRPRAEASEPVLLLSVRSAPPGGGVGEHKTLSRARYEVARATARAAGCDDALLLDDDGAVLETTVANVWVRRDQEWLTPPLRRGVLPGIARHVLLAALRARGAAVVERPLQREELEGQPLVITNAAVGPRAARLLADDSGVDGAAPLRALWQAALQRAASDGATI